MQGKKKIERLVMLRWGILMTKNNQMGWIDQDNFRRRVGKVCFRAVLK